MLYDVGEATEEQAAGEYELRLAAAKGTNGCAETHHTVPGRENQAVTYPV